jgi:hypothetical protein
MHGHKAGHNSSMAETIAYLALGGEELDIEALSQPDWFIDSINGNDNNDGATEETALKTLTELSERWGKGNTLIPPGKVTSVFILTSLPTDVPNFDVIVESDGALLFIGTPIVTNTVPVISVTTRDRTTPAGGTPWSLGLSTGAAQFVTLGTNFRVFDATLDAYFWGWKASGNTLYITEPVTFPGIGSTLSPGNRVAPAATDTFQVQTLPQVTFGQMRIGGQKTGTSLATIVFQDLCLASDFSVVTDPTTEWLYYGCSVINSIEFRVWTSVAFENCFGSGLNLTLNTSGIAFEAGGLSGYFFVGQGYDFTFDFIFEACTCGFFGEEVVEMGTCAFFDAIPIFPGVGAFNVASSTVQLVAFLGDFEAFLWGGGPAGPNTNCVGVSVNNGSAFYTGSGFAGVDVNLTGTLGDFVLGSQLSATAFTRPTPVAGNITTTGPFACTWANYFNPAVFDTTAVLPQTDSWIDRRGA